MTAFTLSQNALRVLETCYLRREALRRIIETPEQRALICFTFFWTIVGCWEGRDFQIAID
jgi:hypothetical protein